MFLSINAMTPVIILPAIYVKDSSYYLCFSDNIDSYEFVGEITIEELRFKEREEHLKRGCEKVIYDYYTTALELTDDVRKNILDYCEERNLIAEFLSIDEIRDIQEYILDTGEHKDKDVLLERSLKLLEREMKME